MKRLWENGPFYEGDSVGGDSLALAAFASEETGRIGCDLGCGSGILLLLSALAQPGRIMHGVDIRQSALNSCRSNLRANALSDRCTVEHCDLRYTAFPLFSMDFVLSNPPYFPAGRGAVSPDRERAAMRTESATVSELCAAAARLLKDHGTFYFVHRAERMAELFSALREAGLEPKRVRLMASAPGSVPALFLCAACKGGAAGIAWEPTLYQRDAAGKETAEYRKITHWEA